MVQSAIGQENPLELIPNISGVTCILSDVKENYILSPDAVKDVKELIIENSSVPKMIIASFPPLLRLIISRNQFTALNFDGISDKRRTLITLEYLDASHNNISFLRDTTFLQMPDLRWIDLSHNRINMINGYLTFNSLVKLQYLDMSHNLLDVFKLNFKDCPELEQLIFDYNPISVWPFGFPKENPTLKISMEGCKLQRYESKSTKGEMNLNGNCLEKLSYQKSTRVVSANDNQIKEISVGFNVEIQKLALANNLLTDITNITEIVNLQNLDLSGNNLRDALKGDILRVLTQLTDLNLSNTSMDVTPMLFEN